MKIAIKIASLSVFLSFFILSCQEPVITNTGGDLTRPSSTPSASETPLESPAPTASTLNLLQGVVQELGTGRLLAGVRVRLNEQEQITDEAGFYRFSSIEPGPAKLLVISNGFVDINQTLTLVSGSQIEDISLTPTASTSPAPTVTPSSTATTPPAIILLPDGSTATETPAPSATASPSSPLPSPTPSVAPSVEPEPTPSPAYDPALDEAAEADLTINRKTNGLSLVLQLKKANGLPIIWEGGTVFVEYFIGTPENQILTSGKSLINSSDDRFVVSLGSRNAGESVNVDISLLLPNQKTLKLTKSVTIQN